MKRSLLMTSLFAGLSILSTGWAEDDIAARKAAAEAAAQSPVGHTVARGKGPLGPSGPMRNMCA